MAVDVIIPVYKPGEELVKLLDALNKQTLHLGKVILINTNKTYFDDFLNKYGENVIPPNAALYHVTEQEYDHGGTRHMAVGYSEAEYFVCMTQDAVPRDEFLLEKLYQAMTDQVAAAYARQLATEASSTLEKISRKFNYPEESMVKNRDSLEKLGIKTYFCSNVCAIYKRNVYNELGGFVRHTIFNEDMLFAAKAVQAGYSIVYAADACVYHAHNYTNGQQFHRNFDLGVSQADHPEVFQGVKSESEGKKLVAYATKELWHQHQFGKLIGFYLQCASKYAGFLLGKRYRNLPGGFVRRCSSNKAYWK